MDYEVKLEQFSGPLDKLLQLIEERHLDITHISLAEVTADFLNYVKKLGATAEPKILADFLVVAAHLVLIKSKTLLPSLELTEEEKTDIKDLESRLKLYQEFKRAGEAIRKLWLKNSRSFGRPLFMNLGDESFFYPPKKLTTQDLINSLRKILSALQDLVPKIAKIKETVISIESKIRHLLARFQETAEHSFKKIAEKGSRKEIIVIFLAVLHLLKDRLIQAEQEKQFGDIILKKSK